MVRTTIQNISKKKDALTMSVDIVGSRAFWQKMLNMTVHDTNMNTVIENALEEYIKRNL